MFVFLSFTTLALAFAAPPPHCVPVDPIQAIQKDATAVADPSAKTPAWQLPLRLVPAGDPHPMRGLLSIGVGKDAAAHVSGRVGFEGDGRVLWGHRYDLEKEDGDAWNLERRRFYLRPVRDPDVLVLGIEAAEDARLVLRMNGVDRRFALEDLTGDGIVTGVGRVSPVWIQFRDATRAAAAPWSLGPGGRRAWRTSLHTHSCFSDSRATLGDSIRSLLPWVRQVWWTDHDLSGSRAVPDGGFEVDPDPLEVARGAIARDGVLLWPEERARRKQASAGVAPGDVPAWPWEHALTTGNAWRPPRGAARVLSAGLDDADPLEGKRCYALAAETPEGGGGAPAEVSVRNGRALLCALAAQPRLHFAVRIDADFPEDARALVDLDLSSQARLRWRIRPGDENGGEAARNGGTGDEGGVDPPRRLEKGPRGFPLLVEELHAPRGRWTRFEVDPAALHDALLGEAQDGLLWLHLGLSLPGGTRAAARFDAFTLESIQGEGMFRAQREALDDHPEMRSFLGEELTEYRSPGGRFRGVAGPHLTLLFPGDTVPVRSIDAPLTDDARRARIAEVHDAGGVVGMHHIENQVFWDAIHEQRGWGADLIEITHAWLYPARYAEDEKALRDAHGYPRRAHDEHYPYLVRWDRLTGEGLWLTGYAAPDLHELYSKPSRGFFNRGLTWIHAEGDTGRAMLQALRAGRCSFGDWRFDPWLDVETERGFRMGEVVWTDRKRVRVRLVSRGLPEGCRVAPIAGGRRLPVEDIGKDGRTGWIEIDPLEAGFVRLEIEHPIGFLLAATNFVAFAGEPPAGWGAGRAAADVGGMRIRARGGAWLDAVRPAGAGDGAFLLEGRLGQQGGFVELAANPSPPGGGKGLTGAAGGAARGAARWDVSVVAPAPGGPPRIEEHEGAIRVIPRRPGPFRLRVRSPSGLPPEGRSGR